MLCLRSIRPLTLRLFIDYCYTPEPRATVVVNSTRAAINRK